MPVCYVATITIPVAPFVTLLVIWLIALRYVAVVVGAYAEPGSLDVTLRYGFTTFTFDLPYVVVVVETARWLVG